MDTRILVYIFWGVSISNTLYGSIKIVQNEKNEQKREVVLTTETTEQF